MKKASLLFFAMAAFVFSACNNSNTDNAVETTDAKKVKEDVQGAVYQIDTANSTIYWKATKKIGAGHEGTFSLASGRMMESAGKIVGGEFTIDMSSLKNTDLEDEGEKSDLVGHLMSPDFFDVAKFPTARFILTSVTPNEGEGNATHTVKGNFTLKGVEKGIVIPATIKIENGTLSATTDAFIIDRTAWGIKYGSGALGVAQNKIINDGVEIKMDIKALKE